MLFDLLFGPRWLWWHSRVPNRSDTDKLDACQITLAWIARNGDSDSRRCAKAALEATRRS
jgi:hypothetical protein